MKGFINTTKKRIGAATLCGALALSLGATAGLASPGGATAEQGSAGVTYGFGDSVALYSVYDSDAWSEIAYESIELVDGDVLISRAAAELSDSIMLHEGAFSSIAIKIEDGKQLFSTDGGETWSEELPEGLNIKAAEPMEGFALPGFTHSVTVSGVLCKVEDGKRLFSTDNGETWSEEAPEGSEFEGEMVTFRAAEPMEGFALPGFAHSVTVSGVLCKVEDGKRLYSIDNGETWSEEAPEGSEIEGGMVTFEAAPGMTGMSMLIKVEDGKRLYSADGGETWSEELPEGMVLPDELILTQGNAGMQGVSFWR